MKKLLLVTTITILGLAHVNAQDVKLGIKGGLNFATLTGGNNSEIGWTTDFNLGVMAEIKISEKFSFQPELIYSGQGYGSENNSEGIIALNYLNEITALNLYFTVYNCMSKSKMTTFCNVMNIFSVHCLSSVFIFKKLPNCLGFLG